MAQVTEPRRSVGHREVSRSDYTALSPSFRRAISDALGADVVEAVNIEVGYTSGPASRCLLSDGRRVFLKAAERTEDEHAFFAHQREIAVLAKLPADVPAPRLVAHASSDQWVGLVCELIDGSVPRVPISEDDLHLVLRIPTTISMAAPVADYLEPYGNTASTGGFWTKLTAETRDRFIHLARGINVQAVLELEQGWTSAVAGDGLIHADMRLDNVLLAATGATAVDWSSAARGQAWVDTVHLLASLRLLGGPSPDPLLRAHPTAQDTDDEAIDSYLCALSGYFALQTQRPEPPRTAGLRRFQSEQARVLLEWLAARRGWRDGSSSRTSSVGRQS